jgi:hypothetical protein
MHKEVPHPRLIEYNDLDLNVTDTSTEGTLLTGRELAERWKVSIKTVKR